MNGPMHSPITAKRTDGGFPVTGVGSQAGTETPDPDDMVLNMENPQEMPRGLEIMNSLATAKL